MTASQGTFRHFITVSFKSSVILVELIIYSSSIKVSTCLKYTIKLFKVILAWKFLKCYQLSSYYIIMHERMRSTKLEAQKWKHLKLYLQNQMHKNRSTKLEVLNQKHKIRSTKLEAQIQKYLIRSTKLEAQKWKHKIIFTKLDAQKQKHKIRST